MSTQIQPTDQRFLSTAIEHRFIAESQATQLREDLDHSLEPITELVVSRGILDRTEVECIRALANPRRYAPGFEILDVIGKGGMGVVFFARQIQLDRFVALKTVYRSNYETLDGLKRFRREASVIGTLRHPNIVTAYEVCESDGRVFLAMEFVDGIDLEQWVELNGPLREAQVWLLVRKICIGLRHAARHGIIHRDIKPSNVLLAECADEIDEQGDGLDVKIADFGLAIRSDPNQCDERLTSAFTTLGSPHYMAPEQFDHALVDLRCDIYGVGATTYHLLTGHPPLHELQTAQIVAHKIRNREIELGEQLKHLSETSRELLKDMLAPRAEHRIQDYDQLIARLDRLIDEQGWQDSQLGTISPRLTELRQDSLPEPTVSLAAPTVETEPILIDTAKFRRRPGKQHIVGVTAALAIPVAGLFAMLGSVPGLEFNKLAGIPESHARTIAQENLVSEQGDGMQNDGKLDAPSDEDSAIDSIQVVSRALIPFPPTISESDEVESEKDASEEMEPMKGMPPGGADKLADRDRPARIPRAGELIVLPAGQAPAPVQNPVVQNPPDRQPQVDRFLPMMPPPLGDAQFGRPPHQMPPRHRPPNGSRMRHVNHR